MPLPHWGLALLFVSFLQVAFAQGFSSVERVVVFGDRLSDTGRVGGVPEADNRLWVEELAAKLFVELPSPYNASTNPGGLNFAEVGSTTIGDTTFDNGNEQLDLYLNEVLAGGQVPANTLIVVWFGLNDLLQNGDVSTVADGVSGLVGRLVEAGAESVIVPNMLPLGRTPKNNNDVATWNAIASDFNTAMSLRLTALAGLYPDATLLTVDVFSLIEDMVADPNAYGMLDVELASSFSAADPGTSLWWSLVSPTSLTHRFIADLAYAGLLEVLPGDASNVVLRLRLSSGGGLSLETSGPLLEILRIEQSTDLENWSTVATYIDFDGSESKVISSGSTIPLYFRAR